MRIVLLTAVVWTPVAVRPTSVSRPMPGCRGTASEKLPSAAGAAEVVGSPGGGVVPAVGVGGIVDPGTSGGPTMAVVRLTDETMTMVPVIVTVPAGTEAPSVGVTNANSGTAGVGVGVGTNTIIPTVLLAWLVSMFLAVMSNWLLPDCRIAWKVQWPVSSAVTTLGSWPFHEISTEVLGVALPVRMYSVSPMPTMTGEAPAEATASVG